MLGIRFIKVPPTTYLIQYRGGNVVREGAGLSFFYYSPVTSLVAVPVGSMDVPFIFEEVAADYQAVTLQGQVTYRITDARKLASLLNFTLASDGQNYTSEDPRKLSARVINQIHVLARAELENITLRQALRASETIVQAVRKRLGEATELTSMGVEIIGLSILAVKPTPEHARALEAETREQLLREADEAIHDRRNAAVEQERAIRENELNTEIAVENKKRQIRETQMDAERSVQQKRHEIERADLDANIGLEDQRKQLVALSAENARAESDARAYGIQATMQALAKADKIGQLNISPDLLRELLEKPARRL